jgi:hypothetical protein
MHPLIYLVVEIALTVFIIGFTTPHSALRPVALLIITLCVVQCIPSCMAHMKRTPWAALVGGYSITYLYHYMDIALLSRWSFEHDAPVSGLLRPNPQVDAHRGFTSPRSKSMWERLKFGIKLTSTFRFVGTQYEVRTTPRPNSPSSKETCRRTFLVIVVSYLLLDFINSNNDPVIAIRFLCLEKIPIFARLREVTAEEVIIRTFTVLAAGVSLICVQGGIYNICALLAISTGISTPPEWPPFYGSAREAYMLTRFWESVYFSSCLG